MNRNGNRTNFNINNDLDYLREHAGWFLGAEFSSITFGYDGRRHYATLTVSKDQKAYYCKHYGVSHTDILRDLIRLMRSDKKNACSFKLSNFNAK